MSIAASETRLLPARAIESPQLRLSEHPPAGRVLVHISDTHLRAGGAKLYDVLDSEQRLAEALFELEGMRLGVDALVFTGDLADFGEPEAYQAIKELVDTSAQRMGAEVIWVMGNHDNRSAFRAHILGEEPSSAPVDLVHDLGGLRIISLDTTIPGFHHGDVTAEQLQWLAETLAIPAEHGTILAMHHPPIPMIKAVVASVELTGQRELADVLRGTDVRAILSGHLHYSSHSTFAGIPVSVASATCYTQDLTTPFDTERPRDGAQAFNLVHIFDDAIVHTVVPMGHGDQLAFVSAEDAELMLAAAGVRSRA
jgi:Icc protein